MDAETVPDWHVAFTGGVASVAMLSLRCSFCLHLSANARGDSTPRLASFAVQWFDLENPEEVTCPGDYNIKCNAFQASAVGRGPFGRWPWVVVARGPMCTFALHAFSSQVDGAARCP